MRIHCQSNLHTSSCWLLFLLGFSLGPIFAEWKNWGENRKTHCCCRPQPQNANFGKGSIVGDISSCVVEWHKSHIGWASYSHTMTRWWMPTHKQMALRNGGRIISQTGSKMQIQRADRYPDTDTDTDTNSRRCCAIFQKCLHGNSHFACKLHSFEFLFVWFASVVTDFFQRHYDVCGTCRHYSGILNGNLRCWLVRNPKGFASYYHCKICD